MNADEKETIAGGFRFHPACIRLKLSTFREDVELDLYPSYPGRGAPSLSDCGPQGNTTQKRCDLILIIHSQTFRR